MHILILVASLLAVGCTPTIVDYSVRIHVVRAGDTLQMVAWRHGLDTRDLARWNQLENPDLIFVGQRLILMPAGGAQAAVVLPALEPSSTVLTPNWQWSVLYQTYFDCCKSLYNSKTTTQKLIPDMRNTPIYMKYDGEIK